MPLNTILASQERWADARWPGHSGRRAPSLEANLIRPMSPESRKDFAEGSGGELGRNGKPGKMSSIRSSSALSYNVFDPWRGQNLRPVALALGVRVSSSELCFERKFRHGLSSTPPNIDVVLGDTQERPLGIECKFTEPYGKKASHPPLDSKYFVGQRARWTDQGLPRCQELAAAIGKRVAFERLAAGQLLKHVLGLAWTTRKPPRLAYVWFDSDCEEAAEHRTEIEMFRSHIDTTVQFTEITYQTLFGRMKSGVEPIPGYYSYLSERYFAG